MPALKKPSGNGARSVPRRCLPSSEVSRQALASAPSVTTASFWWPAICRASILITSRPLPRSRDRPRPWRSRNASGSPCMSIVSVNVGSMWLFSPLLFPAGSRGADDPSIVYPVKWLIAHSGTGHVPDLLDLRARITNHLGDRAEAMKIGLYLFHIGLVRVRRYIDDETDFWKRHFDFFKQLRAATVESRLGINCHGLEVDAVFLRAFVGDDVGAGDQCSHHSFGWRRAHVCAFAFLGFIDDRLDVAYGNLRARMGGTVTPNTLREGGLLFHNNHDRSSCCVDRRIEIGICNRIFHD